MKLYYCLCGTVWYCRVLLHDTLGELCWMIVSIQDAGVRFNVGTRLRASVAIVGGFRLRPF